MPQKKSTKARCKVCSGVGEKTEFKLVSENFLQCGRIYHEEEKLVFEEAPPKTMYYVCKNCHEKYDLIGRWKSSPPDHVDFCYLCKGYTEEFDRGFPAWTINFQSRKWCHKFCLSRYLRNPACF